MKLIFTIFFNICFILSVSSQVTPSNNAALGPCNGCNKFWTDNDGDNWGVLPILWDSSDINDPPPGYANKAGDCNDNNQNITILKWYKDSDDDGFGNLSNELIICNPPDLTWVFNSLDCNDNLATLNPNTIWYVDNDKDGFGSNIILSAQCLKPLNGVLNNTDCDDTRFLINPNTKWYIDTDNDGFGESSTSTITSCLKPIGSYANNNSDNCPNIAGQVFGCTVPINTSGNNSTYNQNYIISSKPKIPVTSLSAIIDMKDISINVSYFDGLGRPIQNIAIAQSNSGKDIVTPIEYDFSGRQTKEYLPYVNNTSASTLYKDNGLTDVLAFYNNPNYENTLNPFSEKEFEASPLNRVLKQAAPGNDWKLGSGHEIKMDYQTNTGAEVKYHNATTTWNSARGLYDINIVSTGNYDANQLYKTVTRDENSSPSPSKGGVTEEFKNKEGQVVLKRTYNTNNAHDTYYVYDIYGNLTYVIPPKAEGAIDNNTLNNLCYQYKYDYRNRLVEKKLPGKQWEFIVYDKLDRPVATGPAFSPFINATANTVGWIITKYDAFSRPVYTGWQQAIVNETERATKQTAQNSLTTTLNETKQTSGTIDGIAAYYSNAVAPTTFKLLSVNYYDDYNFPITPAISFTNVEGQAVYYNNTLKPKGMPTGSWIRTLTTDTAIIGETAYTLYDYKARPIRSFTSNHLGGYTQVDSKLDFIGKTEFTKTRHKYNASSIELLVTENFTYSAQDRLLTHTHQVNSMPAQLLADNTYDELGQLISKKVGNNVSMPLQKVDYKYNIRGWLTGINNDATNNLVLNNLERDLFAFKINYNTVQNISTYVGKPLFNGNISETHWRTWSDGVLRKYGYQYDDLNRLLNSIYQRPENAVPVTNSYNENIAYDKNGNITTLVRNGDADSQSQALQIDYLDYQYQENNNSNRLAKVSDINTSPSGFKNGTNTGDDYTYDANGNMISDANKGITAITYNHLNLPTKIFFGSNTIEYLYDATGQKLQKLVTQGTVIAKTEYLQGGYQYKDNVLLFFPHAEGYVNVALVQTNCITCKVMASFSFNYVFNHTDHLGNVRVSYGIDPSTGGVKIIEENNYYPFGLKHTNYNSDPIVLSGSATSKGTFRIAPAGFSPYYKYKYNGKELQDELGLNLYDYGARNYDPAIGRWMNIDPLAELGRKWSPYNYAYNSPLKFTDPDGMLPDDKVEKDEEKISEKQLDADAKENKKVNNHINKGFEKYLESQKNQEQEQEDPPNAFMQFLEKLFRMPKSDEEAEESHFWQDFLEGSSKYIEKVGGAFQTAMMIVFPTPSGELTTSSLGAKGLYTVVKESPTKFSVLITEGSATSFYKALNPSWNGVYQYTKGVFSTTSFTTETGTKVILNTISKSTGQPSVKLIEKGGTQVLLRFPKL